MKGIKLIIFDLDGTLVNAYPAIVESLNYTIQRLGYPTQDASVIRRAVGWGDKNLLRPFIKIKDLKRALLIYRRHHKHALVRKSHLFPKVKLVLGRIKNKGYRLAVASNRPTKFSWILLHHLKIAKYFGYVLCADRLKYGKPNPEILNRIMQRFALKPNEALYVGDMAIDVKAARFAGVKTIVVPTGSNTRQELHREKPYRIIKGIADLLKIL